MSGLEARQACSRSSVHDLEKSGECVRIVVWHKRGEEVRKYTHSSLHSAEDRSGELSGGTPIGVCGEHESL